MGLGRNFLNSVVTQVGRDTGRIISNQVYGDAHSIPIRRVGGVNSYTNRQNTEISEQEAREILDKEDFKPKKLKSNLTIIIWFVFSFVLMAIAPIIHLINGLIKLNRKTTTYEKVVKSPYYTQDRRYRSGRRLAGYTDNKLKINMPATDEEKKQYRNRGFLQIILGCTQLVILLIILKTK